MNTLSTHQPDKELAITQDTQRGTVTIEGVTYSANLFTNMGYLPIGSLFRIIFREDGILTVQTYAPGETAVG